MASGRASSTLVVSPEVLPAIDGCPGVAGKAARSLAVSWLVKTAPTTAVPTAEPMDRNRVFPAVATPRSW